MEFTVRIEKEHLSTGAPIYVATCLDLDVAGQGNTVEEATDNVRYAVTDIVETAPPSELRRRLRSVDSAEVFFTHIEVSPGQTEGLVGASSV